MEEKLLQEGGAYERKANPEEPGLQTQLINRTSFRNCVLSWRRREDKSKGDRQFNRERHLEQLQKKTERRKSSQHGWRRTARGARSSEDLPSKTNIADGGGPDPGPALGLSAAGSAGPFAGSSPALFKQAPPSSGTLQAWNLPTAPPSSSPLTLKWDERRRD